jgi:hypothetical protein
VADQLGGLAGEPAEPKIKSISIRNLIARLAQSGGFL